MCFWICCVLPLFSSSSRLIVLLVQSRCLDYADLYGLCYPTNLQSLASTSLLTFHSKNNKNNQHFITVRGVFDVIQNSPATPLNYPKQTTYCQDTTVRANIIRLWLLAWFHVCVFNLYMFGIYALARTHTHTSTDCAFLSSRWIHFRMGGLAPKRTPTWFNPLFASLWFIAGLLFCRRV